MLESEQNELFSSHHRISSSSGSAITMDAVRPIHRLNTLPYFFMYSKTPRIRFTNEEEREDVDAFLQHNNLSYTDGIGITLEESLIFWRSEFGKMMELEKFDKQYAYNIRHNYGKEGKRADYTPFSCMKIIMSNQPGPGDCHGYGEYCGECICEKCQTAEHQLHRIHGIREAKTQTDGEINGFIDELDVKISSCQRVLEKIELSYNSTVEKIVAVRQNVREKVNSLVRILRTHEKTMISELEHVQLDLRQDILSNKRGYENLLLQMLKARDIMGEIIDRGIDIEMLNLHNSMRRRMDELLVVPVEDTKQKSVSFDYAHNDTVLEILESTDLGQIKISFTDPSCSEITNENLHHSVTGTGERLLFEVITRDSEGNISYSEEDRLAVRVQSEKGHTIQPRIENLKDGNYKVGFTPLKPDVLMVHVTVMGESIRGSPFQMYVKSSIEYHRESLLSDSTRSMPSGEDTPVMSPVTIFGLNKGHFGRPCGISLNASCDVFAVADSKNRTVHVLGVEGKVFRMLGEDKNSNICFSNPVGIAFDQDENIFVTDCDSHVVNVFDPTGQCKRTFGSRHLQRPLGICCGPDGSSFVCDSAARSIKKFSWGGTFEVDFKSPDIHPSGKRAAPYFITQHKDKFYVTFDNHSVQAFDGRGTFLYKIGDKGHGEGRFKDPRGLAVDSNDRLFVCDTGNHRVQVFSVDGRISLFGSYGAQLGQLDRPQDIAISHDGTAFVTDYNNARIQVFRQ
ncbi:hypothetical protein QZH41_003710 [Actinostola sp. cb2023]|nr:hypothetical protein QZH41_003710 [Actinostola sp. cb2023]